MRSEAVVEIPWSLSKLPQHGQILDVGSCDATYLSTIRQGNRALHCLDSRNCKDGIPAGAEFYHTNFLGNGLPKYAFDAILMIAFLAHIGLPGTGKEVFPEGDALALAESWRLLKPDGVLIATLPAGCAKTTPNYRQYSPQQIKNLFAKWDTEVTYWGFDGLRYTPIQEDSVTNYDYLEPGRSELDTYGAGAMAGIVAYKHPD